MSVLPRKRPQKRTWLSLEAEQPCTPRACPLSWSLSGDKRTWHDHRQSVAYDPERHFATANCRIAKGLFDHPVGGHKQGLRPFEIHWKTSPSDSDRSGAASDLFHQPPPSDWNKATVSAKRAALAWARLSRAC